MNHLFFAQAPPHLELFPVPELLLASGMAEVVVMFAKFSVHVGHYTLDERRGQITIVVRNEHNHHIVGNLLTWSFSWPGLRHSSSRMANIPCTQKNHSYYLVSHASAGSQYMYRSDILSQ